MALSRCPASKVSAGGKGESALAGLKPYYFSIRVSISQPQSESISGRLLATKPLAEGEACIKGPTA
jgi:hypothetical protein